MSRVTLTNPFDLLTDENEDRTNVPQPKKEQKPAAPAKPAAKPAATGAAKPAAKPEAKAPAKPATTKPATGNSAPQTVKPAPPRDSNQNLQERDKETRAPRDNRDRPARPAGDSSKRAFDRKSGTGRVKNEQSRGGRGRGNWGEVDTKEGVEALKEKEEKPEEKEEAGDENEKVTVEGEKKEGEAPKAEATEAAKKEEEEVFTYDEYLKSRKSKAPQVEALKPRSVTDNDFAGAGLVPLQREENGAAPLGKKEKKTEKPAAAAAPATKESEKKERNLAAELLKFASHQDTKRQERRNNYGDERRGDDRRGNFSEKRGRGNGPRQPRPDNRQPAAAAAAQLPVQEKDFPTLGPHGSNPVKA